MKEKIKPFLNIIRAYKMLLLMWFAEGLMVLITGRINRIIYGCVWLTLLLEYRLNILDEEWRS